MSYFYRLCFVQIPEHIVQDEKYSLTEKGKEQFLSVLSRLNSFIKKDSKELFSKTKFYHDGVVQELFRKVFPSFKLTQKQIKDKLIDGIDWKSCGFLKELFGDMINFSDFNNEEYEKNFFNDLQFTHSLMLKEIKVVVVFCTKDNYKNYLNKFLKTYNVISYIPGSTTLLDYFPWENKETIVHCINNTEIVSSISW